MRQLIILLTMTFATSSALACSGTRLAAWESAVADRPLNSAATAESIASSYNITFRPHQYIGGPNC